jgi:sugar lactone lactonase YvrE
VELGIPYGMAFDTNDNLYVSHLGGNASAPDNNTVSKITPDGVVTVVASGLNGPAGLAFDSKGNLYVAISGGYVLNCNCGTILKITPSGTGSTFAAGLVSPYYLAIDSNDVLFVSDWDAHKVVRFTPDGGSSVFADLGANHPSGIAFDRDGSVFVADSDGGRILKYAPSGAWSVFATGLGNPLSLAVGDSIPKAAIQTQPGSQTAEAGSEVSLGIVVQNVSTPTYEWFLNATNAVASGTNAVLRFNDVQFSDAGIYTVVVTDPYQTVTSMPAGLNITAPVPRRNVPGIQVGGVAPALVNMESRDSLGPGVPWVHAGTVSLSTNSAWYFDLSAGGERFYRAWTTNAGGQAPVLALFSVPALTLTGNLGGTVRVDGINRFGPVDAWYTLGVVQLTNATELFFDVSASYSPARVYRLVAVP